jgi:GDP-mannose 6-dehydrogenase
VIVAVVGLGRVGLVTAAELAAAGRTVIGVDPSAPARRAVESGRAHFPEPGLSALLARARRRGRLTASADLADAAVASVVFICVGTPPRAGGRLDVSAVAAVCRALSRLPAPRGGRVLAVRSTLPPGSMRSVLAPLLPPAARRMLVLVPEFAREGEALADDASGRRLVAGAVSKTAARRALSALGRPRARVFIVDWTTAELAKSADNAFHAVKAAFANELAAVGRALGADGEAVLEILRADALLNASAAYLRPGDAYGGPCLDKDVRALTGTARRAGAAPLLLAGATASNERRLDEFAARAARGARRAAVLGLAFKAGTGDLRGSTALAVAARLAARGLRVTVHDPALPAGARLPRRVRAAPTAAKAAAGADIVVLGPGATPAARRAARGRRVLRLR